MRGIEVRDYNIGKIGAFLVINLVIPLTNVSFYDKEDIKAFTRIPPKSIPTLLDHSNTFLKYC